MKLQDPTHQLAQFSKLTEFEKTALVKQLKLDKDIGSLGRLINNKDIAISRKERRNVHEHVIKTISTQQTLVS